MNSTAKWLRKPILIACMAIATGQGVAQTIWVEDDKNNLFTIDAQNNLTFAATIWGAGLGIIPAGTTASGVAVDFAKQITDIAFVGTQLYGITPDSLFKIDRATGAATFEMSLANNAATRPFTSLVYDPNTKNLLAADDPKNNAQGNLVPGQLFTIDLANKLISSVNPDPTGAGSCSSHQSTSTCTPDTNVAFRSSGDLAFVGSQLFLSSNTPTADTLVTLVNGQGPLTAGQPSPTLKNGVNAVPQVWGLATVGTTLYGMAGQSLYTVDASGAMTLLKTYSTAVDGVSQFNGATYGGPAGMVPEPGTYAMLLAGLGVIGLLVRRRLPGVAS